MWLFELLIRVSKTTVSPCRCLIWRVNPCLRPYVSIYRSARERDIHINSLIEILREDNRVQQEETPFLSRALHHRELLSISYRGRDPPVRCLSLQSGGGKHRWVPGKRRGIYRAALIYALTAVLFNSPNNPTRCRISWN